MLHETGLQKELPFLNRIQNTFPGCHWAEWNETDNPTIETENDRKK